MGKPARHEPVNTEALHRNAEVFAIFEAAGWTGYFQRLNDFHTETALKFILNLTNTHSEVKGVHIDVTEAILVEVTGLLHVEWSWFGRKTHNVTVV